MRKTIGELLQWTGFDVAVFSQFENAVKKKIVFNAIGHVLDVVLREKTDLHSALRMARSNIFDICASFLRITSDQRLFKTRVPTLLRSRHHRLRRRLCSSELRLLFPFRSSH